MEIGQALFLEWAASGKTVVRSQSVLSVGTMCTQGLWLMPSEQSHELPEELFLSERMGLENK